MAQWRKRGGRARHVAAWMALLLVVGWGGRALGSERLLLYVALDPQKDVAERLVGDRLRVESLLPPGADPHNFEPKPQQMVEMTRALAYISAGLPFEESLVPRLRGAVPHLVIVSGDAGIDKIPMVPPEELFSDAGHALSAEVHGHHAGEDPHFWTSPKRMGHMARTMASALVALDPEGAPIYQRNLGALEEDIAALESELAHLLEGRRGMAFLVFHPAWGYFAADFGLRQIPVEAEGKEPKAADLTRLIRFAREKGVEVIFVSPQFSSKGAAVVAAEMGATLVELDPLARGWMENLRRVGHLLHDAAK